jgi:molecular chaperone DnaK
MRGRNFNILWRQDYFVVDRFNWLTQSPALYVDKALYAHLVARGREAMAKDEVGKLREIVAALYDARVQVSDGDDTLAPANIVRS